MSPKKLNSDFSEYGYSMELDIRKRDCNSGEAPHWHLCHKGRRIGKIFTDGQWAASPEVSPFIIREAERLTKRFSDTIKDYYAYNAEHGEDF